MKQKWILIIGDAWEQQYIYTFEATGISTAQIVAAKVLQDLNSKDDVPLYQIDGIVKESVFSAFGIEATGTGETIEIDL